MNKIFQNLLPLSLALTVLGLVGCGDQGLPLVTVSGKVTFDGGPCPNRGVIIFLPLETTEGLPKRPGTGTFGEDGTYVVTSFKEGDGLLPGKYRATVTCDSSQSGSKGPAASEGISNIGPGYEPTEIIVEKDSVPMTLDIDVPLKKRK